MNPLILKLASRKLVVALGTVSTLLATRQFVPAAVVAATYIAGQAHIDAKTEVLVAQAVQRVAQQIEAEARAKESYAGVPAVSPSGIVIG